MSFLKGGTKGTDTDKKVDKSENKASVKIEKLLDDKEKRLLLLLAGFGGIAPNFVNLTSTLLSGGEFPTWTYIVGMLLMFVVGIFGGLVAQPKTRKTALMCGMGFPALINGGLSGVAKASDLVDHQLVNDVCVVRIENFKENLNLKATVEYPNINLTIDFKNPKIAIPDAKNIKTVKIDGRNVRPLVINKVETNLVFNVQQTTWSGFGQAVGLGKTFELIPVSIPLNH